MERWVEVTFDCLPLRSIGRVDIPIDASPKYRQRCQNIKDAMEKHGLHNSFYLYNARCLFHLTNDESLGAVEFKFEGTVMTDTTDRKSEQCDLSVSLHRENCPWLTEPIVQWLAETVSHAVKIEFDRYIAVGDLEQTVERIEKIQAESDESGGFVGMYL